MKLIYLAGIAAAATASLAVLAANAGQQSADERHKQTVIAFYNAITHGDIATIRKLGDPEYRQHDPRYPDKLDGLISVIASKPARPGDPPITFVRVIAGDGYVVTLRRRPPPNSKVAGEEQAMVDIFRVDPHEKVAEHWTYWETFPRPGAPVPPKNDNGYF